MSQSIQIEHIEFLASVLGDLTESLVFVGGAVVSFLITEESIEVLRETEDIDLVVKVTNRIAYHSFLEQLRQKGFEQAFGEPVICRVRGHGFTLDITPTDELVLGFSNPWYGKAVERPTKITLPNGTVIDVISPPYFIATKLTALADRGMKDIYESHDLEDIVQVINGRSELISELKSAEYDLRHFVATELAKLLANPVIGDVIEGHLAAQQDPFSRASRVIDRIIQISQL